MRLALLSGKVFSEPKRMKTANGKDMLIFSLCVSNNYKNKNGEWINRESTYFDITVFDEELIKEVEKIELKRDIVNCVCAVDSSIEKVKQDKRIKHTYFNLRAINRNNKQFIASIYSVINKKYESIEDTYNPAEKIEQVKEESKDDLPF